MDEVKVGEALEAIAKRSMFHDRVIEDAYAEWFDSGLTEENAIEKVDAAVRLGKNPLADAREGVKGDG